MPGHAFLRGDRVTLRPPTDDDRETILRAHNEPELREGLLHDRPRTAADLERFYEEVADDEDVTLLVCDDAEVLGQVSLFGFEDDHASVAYWTLPEHQGEGYATEAMTLLLEYAFDTLGLHHVCAQVIDYNEASRSFLEELGFEREGRLREHRFRRGRYCDVLQYGLLADEWRADGGE